MARALRSSFNAANPAERHDLQYFEMFCNKGVARMSRFSCMQIRATAVKNKLADQGGS
jgi:hypothetical protein